MEQSQRIILQFVKDIRMAELKDAAYRSLTSFAQRQYNTYLRAFGIPSVFLLLVTTLANPNKTLNERLRAENILNEQFKMYIPRGVPTQTYAEQYLKEQVKPVLDELSKQQALDPDDISGRNTLRNRAEMEVRYNNHIQSIEELRQMGVKLVIASVHADCSQRCSNWQGRVYSLDGSSGLTPDAKQYIPLETATDIYYTTKKGIRYKNGLLGFNCRHYLMPYQSGIKLPTPSASEEKKERYITQRQRELERNVRSWRTRALEYKGIDEQSYLDARRKAIQSNKEYIEFSKLHNRAYYPSRTKLL